ncbi:MAG: hypothetical protein ACO1NY_04395 [Pseudorhodoplanes sp.]
MTVLADDLQIAAADPLELAVEEKMGVGNGDIVRRVVLDARRRARLRRAEHTRIEIVQGQHRAQHRRIPETG